MLGWIKSIKSEKSYTGRSRWEDDATDDNPRGRK